MSSGALSMRSAFAIPWPMANGQFVGLFGEVKTGNCVVDDSSQTFPGVFVHDGEDIERFTRNDQIELEIDGPHVTFFLSNHCWGCQPTNSLPTPFHDYPKSYFSPEALNHLVMDLPAVPASIHLGPPIPPPGMAAGIVHATKLAKPGLGRQANQPLEPAEGGSFQPDSSAGELLSAIKRVDDVNHGPTSTRRGSEVSLSQLVEDRFFEFCFSEQFLQLKIQLLQVFQLLRVFSF